MASDPSSGKGKEQLDAIVSLVTAEVRRAQAKFGPFKNGHEGYAVLLEEVDELWQAIKHGTDLEAMEEAVQVAAMAIRFIYDLRDTNVASHGKFGGSNG